MITFRRSICLAVFAYAVVGASASHATQGANALSNNALSNNALSNNALSNNALSNNALSNNALVSNGLEAGKPAPRSAISKDAAERAYAPAPQWEISTIRPQVPVPSVVQQRQ